MGPIAQLNQSMQAGTPTLDQVTGGSPNFDPSLQPATPAPMPDHMFHINKALQRRGMNAANTTPLPSTGANITLPVQDQNPQQPGTQVTPTEAEKLIAAITKRLDHHSKIEQKLVDSFLPQQEAGVSNRA